MCIKLLVCSQVNQVKYEGSGLKKGPDCILRASLCPRIGFHSQVERRKLDRMRGGLKADPSSNYHSFCLYTKPLYTLQDSTGPCWRNGSHGFLNDLCGYSSDITLWVLNMSVRLGRGFLQRRASSNLIAASLPHCFSLLDLNRCLLG